MNPSASGSIKRFLGMCGHYRRKLANDCFSGVAVLCYHAVRRSARDDMLFGGLHVTVDELAEHCRLVADTCHPISLDDWLASKRDGAPLPDRPVLFTFDDGYRSVFTLARTVLERYRIPATVFVTSEPVRARRPFWHDAIAACEGAAVVERWKELPYDEWRRRVDSATAYVTCGDDSPYAPLRIDDVKELAAHELFTIGGHTSTHAILSRASIEAQRQEIESNRNELESWIGETVRAFAYPNGRPALDFTEDTVEMVRHIGYEAAFTTRNGFATSDEPVLERSRFMMLAGVTRAELAHRLAYSWRRTPSGA